MAEDSKLSGVIQKNKQNNPTNTVEKDVLFQQIRDAINLEKNQRADGESSVRVMDKFISSVERSNKELLQQITKDDKNLLENVLDSITKLQNKTLKEFKESLSGINELASKLAAQAEVSGSDQLKQIAEELKNTLLEERFKAEGLTLQGAEDTLKNRLKKELGITSKEPGQEGKPVQGFKDSVKAGFGEFFSGMKSGARAVVAPRGGLIDRVVSTQESRREQIRQESERTNELNTRIETIKKRFSEVLKQEEAAKQENNKEEPTGNAPDNDGVKEVAGKIYSSNENESAKNIEGATTSARDEERAGITDADPSYSRSSTVTGGGNWEELLKLLKEIRDCVCECNCSGSTDLDPTRRQLQPQEEQQRQRARGTGVIGTALAVGAAGIAAVAAGASKAWDWMKQGTGFGQVGTSNKQPSMEPIRAPVTPETPATEISRPRGLPTPANDNVGIANDNDPFIEEQKKRVNERPYFDGPEEENNTPPKREPPKQGSLEPRERVTPSTPANDVTTKRGNWFSRVWDKTKEISGTVGKKTSGFLEKIGGKFGIKAGEKGLEKGLGKGLIRAGGKHVPGLGVALGGLFAYQRWKAGDKLGALGEVVSAGLGQAGNGYAQAGSLAIDAGLMAKDAGVFGGSTEEGAAKPAERTVGSMEPGRKPPLAANDNVAKPSLWNKVKGFGSRAIGKTKGLFSSKTGGMLSKASGFLGKAGKFAGRLLGKAALPLAAGMALYDGYQGWNADPNATTGQKFMNAGRNVLSGLTFGLVDSTEDKIAAGEYTGSQISPAENKMTAGLETGNNNMSSAIGSVTKDAKVADTPNINVPPPTVIQQPVPVGGRGGNNIADRLREDTVRTEDNSWQRYQNRRSFG